VIPIAVRVQAKAFDAGAETAAVSSVPGVAVPPDNLA
jgi:hypothetical protein